MSKRTARCCHLSYGIDVSPATWRWPSGEAVGAIVIYRLDVVLEEAEGVEVTALTPRIADGVAASLEGLLSSAS